MCKLVLNPVFIDTSIFYQNHFNFSSKQFQQLIELSHKRAIKIILTEITFKEILKKIKELSTRAEDGFNSYIRKKRLVRLYSISNSVETDEMFNKDNIYNKCKTTFERWLEDAKVEILSLNHSNITEVFDLYFSQQAPFKFKKNEFPDAFSLSIVCNQYKRICIVSRDNDMMACQRPEVEAHFNSLNSFINHILQSRNSVHDLIIREYNLQKPTILKTIKDGFPSFIFLSCNGSYTDAAKVRNLSIVEETIIEIKKNSATINIFAIIDYEIMVYYNNKENYELEEDKHLMDIEVVFEFGEIFFGSEFEYVKIIEIRPKSGDDKLVMINEEDFN